jgi:two-component system, chemotaxis family, chemotaxis protein CheY
LEVDLKTLIAEDDFINRLILQKILSQYGESHVAVSGKEAIFAFKYALHIKAPYDLICMDILMPEMSGLDALKEIREIERDSKINPAQHVKVMMVTSVSDMHSVTKAYNELCDAYLVKPIDLEKFQQELKKLMLIEG